MTILRQKVRSLPKVCGVYLMYDRLQKVIYIGKAKNLYSRVQSYFRNLESHSLKTRALLAQIHDLQYITVTTEVEALLLERNLIQHHQPKYNVLLRDDKQYPMVRIDWDATWPRLQVVRKKKEGDKAEYIGPFAQTAELSLVLDCIYEIFPLIRCGEHEFNHAKRPCLYFHMHKCLGQCTRHVDRTQYIAVLQEATQWLKGRKKQLLNQLNEKMWQASHQESYELAAKIRDQLSALKKFQSNQNVQYKFLSNADVIDWVESDQENISVSICMVRNNKLLGHFNQVMGLVLQTQEETILSFLTNYYSQHTAPENIFSPLTEESCSLLERVLTEQGAQPQIKPLQKGEVRTLSNTAKKNAHLHAEHQKIFAQPNEIALATLQNLCVMSTSPERIECIDISHFQGTATVAAIVCFTQGKPDKNEYRLYNVCDETQTPDDYHSIAQVLRRRFKQNSQRPDPHLLIIDGGKGQLEAAWGALEEKSKQHITVIGLAKARTKTAGSQHSPIHTAERLILRAPPQTIELDPASPVCGLVTKIRDEAHRFAISHHRKRRQKIRQTPSLLKIPGIGPVLRKRVLEHFTDLEMIGTLSAVEIAQKVRGMSLATAQRLKESIERHLSPNHEAKGIENNDSTFDTD